MIKKLEKEFLFTKINFWKIKQNRYIIKRFDKKKKNYFVLKILIAIIKERKKKQTKDH